MKFNFKQMSGNLSMLINVIPSTTVAVHSIYALWQGKMMIPQINQHNLNVHAAMARWTIIMAVEVL